MVELKRRVDFYAPARGSMNFYVPSGFPGRLGQQRQPKSDTLVGLSGVERVKYLLGRLLIHSTAVVFNFDSHDVFFYLLNYPNLDAAGAGGQGVLGYIQQVKGKIFHNSIQNLSFILTEKGLAELFHTRRNDLECGKSRADFFQSVCV